MRGQAAARYRISSTGQGGNSGCTSWRAPVSSLCPSSSQPEPESSASVAPRFPEQDEDELHRTLGVERFEEILQEAGSRGGEEPGRSYGEEDFECEGRPVRGREPSDLTAQQEGARGLVGGPRGGLGWPRGATSASRTSPPPCRPPPVLAPHPSPTVHPPASGHPPPQDTPGPRTEASKAPWSLPHWGDAYH